MNAPLTAPARAVDERWVRSTPAWLAASLAVLLVVSGLYLHTIRGGGDDQPNLAWAPATAESSPVADLTCNVEPLTVDEVMETVKNPANGYARLGLTDYALNAADLWESRDIFWYEETGKVGYVRNGNPGILADAAAAADMYSSCIQTGTLLQVWAIMDPAIVQIDVISRFPVFRSEEEVRAFVMESGPQPFSERSTGIIGWFPGSSRPENGSDWLGSTGIDGRANDLAIVSILAESPVEGQPPILTEVSLQLFPNGQWIVTGFYLPEGRG